MHTYIEFIYLFFLNQDTFTWEAKLSLVFWEMEQNYA